MTTLEPTMARVPLAELRPHAMNARRGNVEMIADSLDHLGQFRPVIVNRGSITGRQNEILAGHHLVKAATKSGKDDLLVAFVDVDDDTATRIMIMDNRSNDVAVYDDPMLAKLLQSLPDLTATGFDQDDLDQLIASLPDLDTGDQNPDDGEEPEPEDAIALAGVVVGEPSISTHHGEVWQLGDDHLLIVADIHTEHSLWTQYLDADCLFWPYPTLLAPFAEKARGRRVVMVQPSQYLAGWLLVKWQRVTGNEPVMIGADN